MLIMFLCVSVCVQSYNTSNLINYSYDNVSDKKILVLSDESGLYQLKNDNYVIRTIYDFEPINIQYINKIKEITNISKIYDYYILSSSIDSTGYFSKMNIEVKKNNKIINRETLEKENEYNNYEFSIIPVYPDENIYSQDNGIYISKNLAYLYQLEVGNHIHLDMSVPYAMLKSVEKGTKSLGEGYEYYSYSCLSTNVPFDTKVIGIVESNSLDNEVYMPYDLIQNFIDKQVRRYENGEIKIYKKAFEGYSTIKKLEPYAQVVFADKKENVLKIKNQINQMTDKIYAYNEYQSVLELIEESKEYAKDTFINAIIGVSIFFIGGAVIEIFYLKKYKKTYMMMKLIGYDKKEKNKVFIFHSLYQIMMILCLSCIIYITASLPHILSYLNIISYEESMKYVNEIYNVYIVYCGFSMLHVAIFVIIVILVITTVNIGMKRYYDKKDLITWLRER